MKKKLDELIPKPSSLVTNSNEISKFLNRLHLDLIAAERKQLLLLLHSSGNLTENRQFLLCRTPNFPNLHHQEENYIFRKKIIKLLEEEGYNIKRNCREIKRLEDKYNDNYFSIAIQIPGKNLYAKPFHYEGQYMNLRAYKDLAEGKLDISQNQKDKQKFIEIIQDHKYWKKSSTNMSTPLGITEIRNLIKQKPDFTIEDLKLIVNSRPPTRENFWKGHRDPMVSLLYKAILESNHFSGLINTPEFRRIIDDKASSAIFKRWW